MGSEYTALWYVEMVFAKVKYCSEYSDSKLRQEICSFFTEAGHHTAEHFGNKHIY